MKVYMHYRQTTKYNYADDAERDIRTVQWGHKSTLHHSSPPIPNPQLTMAFFKVFEATGNYKDDA